MCFIDTPDGRHITSHIKPDYTQDLGIATLEEALKYQQRAPTFAVNTNDEIYRDRQIPQLNYMEVKHMTMKDVIQQVYEPKTMVSHVLRDALIVITIFIIILAIMCCFPQVRAWAKACCFINNPTKYWRRYKHYDVPNFTKIPKFDMPETTPIIKTIFKQGGIQKYRIERKERQQRKQIFKNKFEIDEIINKNKAACEAQAKIITAPITQNNKPITPPTAPSTFRSDIPRPLDIHPRNVQVHWKE
jgi:hypothetical protein